MKKKLSCLMLSCIMMLSIMAAGCGSTKPEEPVPAPTITTAPTAAPTDTPAVTEAPPVTEAPAKSNIPEIPSELTTKPAGDNFIELAINVYYNDADNSHYTNEASDCSIYVTKEGQYTLYFDCDTDLSAEAKSKGVSSLTNLTAIYLLDMGTAKGNQSPLKSCNIMFDEIMVDGTPLTITQEAPESAFKSSGIFDTNDPINSWDGSLVAEVNSTEDHVANFTSVKSPKTIVITFTLSDMHWNEEKKPEVTVETTNTYVNNAVFSSMNFSDMNSVSLTRYLGNGINLGNTMEAYGHANLGPKANVSSYETYWGQPVTTAEMIKGMKNCGFDTLRIPVAWTNMMDYENGDYTIAPALLDRVEEIVNYALDAEMFVIVNDHWDGGWWGMFGSKTPETVEKAWSLYESMWTQIAQRFKDYPEMLIFESANEELGNSLNDNTLCTDSGFLTENGKYEMTNSINQKFVDVIRSSGGKNSSRFLLIAGYNTNIDLTCNSKFIMPKDTVDGKLLISVHYYDPWNYCGAEKQSRWGITKEFTYMEDTLAKMTKFTDAGYGVIIGEYGALPVYEGGTHTKKTNTELYTTYFLDNCDKLNFCPVLWSCNDFYSKKKLTMMDDQLLDLFTKRCYQEEVATGEPQYTNRINESMKTAKAASPGMWSDVEQYEVGTPVAWIMWNGGAGTYSVGDTFNPADNTAGIKATNTVVTGPGNYQVSLDFEGGNNGLTFAALAIADGERLYPNGVIKINAIYLDGQKYTINGQPYTSSDDGKCMRVNLFNQWVTGVPDGARTFTGVLIGATPTPLKATDVVNIKNITIDFSLIVR